MARGSGFDPSKALVPIIDPDTHCVTGWGFQVVGDVGEIPEPLVVDNLTVNDTVGIGADLNVGDDLIVSGDAGFSGNSNFQTLEAQSVISDLLNVTPNGGKFLQTSVTAIDANAQIFIPDGANDVTEYIRIDGLVTNGTTRAFLAFALQMGGTLTQNLVTGGDTWTIRLNGDGSVDIRRIAGTGTGQAVIRAMWI